MAEIPQLLVNAWNNFVGFYDKRYLKYSGGEAAAHYVCWKEIDVMGHLMRFLFDEFKNKNINNIEIHLNCSLKQQNYANESFCDSLQLLQEQFAGRRIEVDMAIAKEDEVPFELCIEAKHFHYDAWRTPAEELIREDIKRLQAYKKLKITKSIAFAVLDDYYYSNNPNKSEVIKDILNHHENEMLILYHQAP